MTKQETIIKATCAAIRTGKTIKVIRPNPPKFSYMLAPEHEQRGRGVLIFGTFIAIDEFEFRS